MSLTSIDGGAHADVRPEPSTAISERTGRHASILDVSAYPLTAECAVCERPVRNPHYYGDWTHA